MDVRKMFSSVLLGLGVIYAIAALCSLIFATILKFTAVEESQIKIFITIISFIALFLGGFTAGGRGKEKGWMLGGLTGLLYTVIHFLFEYLGYDSGFSTEQIVYYICFTITAVMGGILGVNIAGNRAEQT